MSENQCFAQAFACDKIELTCRHDASKVFKENGVVMWPAFNRRPAKRYADLIRQTNANYALET